MKRSNKTLHSLIPSTICNLPSLLVLCRKVLLFQNLPPLPLPPLMDLTTFQAIGKTFVTQQMKSKTEKSKTVRKGKVEGIEKCNINNAKCSMTTAAAETEKNSKRQTW